MKWVFLLINTLFLTTAFNFIRVNSSILPQSSNPSDESIYSRSYVNLTKRQDKIMHTAVCSELDNVEDTPFIVLIIVKESGRFLCMGSIIDKYHVLTANACYRQVNIPSLMVVAGYASPYYGRNSQVKYVDKITRHTKELAIIRLVKPFTFTKNVQPIRVIGPDQVPESPEHYAKEPSIIAGFKVPKTSPKRGELMPRGLTYQFKQLGKVVEAKTACGKLSNEEFGSDILANHKDEEVFFCSTGEAEFCWTAVGSPTIMTKDNMLWQTAMVIWGKCRYLKPTPKPSPKDNKKNDKKITEYAPFVHTRLNWFYKWIKANSLIDR